MSVKADPRSSAISCPICKSEMSFEANVRTVRSSIGGPYVSVTTRIQCRNQECAYYERTAVQAHDPETIKAAETHGMQFIEAIPKMGQWRKSRVTVSKYRYRRPFRSSR